MIQAGFHEKFYQKRLLPIEWKRLSQDAGANVTAVELDQELEIINSTRFGLRFFPLRKKTATEF
jgi:hypothetical protein